MKKKLVVCAASMAIIVMGASFLATPARASASLGECPATVAQNVKSLTTKTCQKAGYSESVITYMNCENNEVTYAFVCA